MRETGHDEACHHVEGRGPRGLLWIPQLCFALCYGFPDRVLLYIEAQQEGRDTACRRVCGWALLRRLGGSWAPEIVQVRFFEEAQAVNNEPPHPPQTPAHAEAVPPQSAPQPRCVIVVVGASAGGLEAFETFFAQMPPDSGMAFVLVQHLAPDRESLLPELLARHTRMPVRQLTAETPVEPDHVYIIPPNATLTITAGVLHVVSPPMEPRGHRTPIDRFFHSLAEDQGEYAVCIILSGTGTDGTLGLQAVKEYGGMAMAQTPASARYDSLLRSAIATGLVDHILPVEAMPAKLREYVTHLTTRRDLGGPPDLHVEVGAHLPTIYGLLRRQTGHDFSQYKENMIYR